MTRNQERNNIDEEENDGQEDSTNKDEDFKSDDGLDELLGIKKGDCKLPHEKHNQTRTGLQREIPTSENISLPLSLSLSLSPHLSYIPNLTQSPGVRLETRYKLEQVE